MKHTALLGVAAIVLAFPAFAAGQENYTMKFKSQGKGESMSVKKTDTQTQKFRVSDATGNELDSKDEKTVTTNIYLETILELPDPEKDPTRFKRVYEKAEVKSGDEVKTLPLQGKTIVIEQKDNKYSFSYEDGGKLTDEENELLVKEFKGDDQKKGDFAKLLIPKETVKIGEDWKIPAENLVKALELKDAPLVFDLDKAKATGKLAKITKKNGSDIGDLVFKIELPIKTIKTPDIDIDFKPPAMFIFDFTVTGCIDGTRSDGVIHMTGKLDGKTSLEAGGESFHLEMSVGIAGDWTTSEVRKK